MKKSPKTRKSSTPQKAGPDLAEILSKMEQQIAAMSAKLDALISQSPKRPSEEKNISRPFQNYDRTNNQNERRQNNIFRERTFFKVICADCNKGCEVPFKPSGDRPVYCKECFSKRKTGLAPKVRTDTPPQGQGFVHHRVEHKEHIDVKPKAAEKKKAVTRRKKKLHGTG